MIGRYRARLYARQLPIANGTNNMDGRALLKHHEEEALVLWAWNPGRRPDGSMRTQPPLSHAQFVAATRTWVEAGTPCPPANRRCSHGNLSAQSQRPVQTGERRSFDAAALGPARRSENDRAPNTVAASAPVAPAPCTSTVWPRARVWCRYLWLAIAQSSRSKASDRMRLAARSRTPGWKKTWSSVAIVRADKS